MSLDELDQSHIRKTYTKLNQSFIESWTIPEYICDDILQYYKDNTELHMKGVTLSQTGAESKDKDSTDVIVNSSNFDKPFYDYRHALQQCLDSYVETFPMLMNVARFNVVEPYNIQHYSVSGGFKSIHCERDGHLGKNIRRCLAFMTYLNDVDDGGTEFIHQNRLVKAIKGKTLIWPSDWTHAHVGQISHTKEKTIVTGWFSHTWGGEMPNVN